MSLRSDAVGYALAYGVPADMFDRFIETESHYSITARGSHGEVGICQIIPRLHPNVDAADAQDSMRYAAATLRVYKDTLGDWPKAFAAWNAGPVTVQLGKIPSSTRSYVQKILPNFTPSITTNVPSVAVVPAVVSVQEGVTGPVTVALLGMILSLVVAITIKAYR